MLRGHQRRAGALLCYRGVVVLLADRLLGDQAPVARQVLLAVDQVRLGLRQIRLGLRQLSLEGPLVDDVEKLAFPYRAPSANPCRSSKPVTWARTSIVSGAWVCATYSS